MPVNERKVLRGNGNCRRGMQAVFRSLPQPFKHMLCRRSAAGQKREGVQSRQAQAQVNLVIAAESQHLVVQRATVGKQHELRLPLPDLKFFISHTVYNAKNIRHRSSLSALSGRQN